MKKIVIGNWKMNPTTLEQAKKIIADIKKSAGKVKNVVVVACPPFPYVGLVGSKGQLFSGAQNVHFEDSGAYTGEVSASILVDLGLKYVIVGHSERRKMGETSDVVAKKAAATAAAGMTAVVCIGESVRDAQGDYIEPLKEQIKQSLQGFTKKSLSKLIVAYEPVWTSGAKEAMTPALIHETVIFIKKTLADIFGQHETSNVPILYGGSVNFRNAADIITLGEVDGLLVGRESINPPGFADLLKAVDATVA